MSLKKDMSCSFDGNTSMKGEKLVYPAASRNKEPILQVLKKYLRNNESNTRPQLLEIASGSGQHSAHFAPHFPNIDFQPSEFDETLLGSITYYAQNCATKNMKPPIQLDVCTKLSEYGFRESSLDYIYNANMIHISPYKCTIGLFMNAGLYLKPNGLLITYGPYGKDGIITPESNVSFNASLKARDPEWGIRDITELIKLASSNHLSLIESIDMPANNKTLIWKKIVA